MHSTTNKNHGPISDHVDVLDVLYATMFGVLSLHGDADDLQEVLVGATIAHDVAQGDFFGVKQAHL